MSSSNWGGMVGGIWSVGTIGIWVASMSISVKAIGGIWVGSMGIGNWGSSNSLQLSSNGGNSSDRVDKAMAKTICSISSSCIWKIAIISIKKSCVSLGISLSLRGSISSGKKTNNEELHLELN